LTPCRVGEAARTAKPCAADGSSRNQKAVNWNDRCSSCSGSGRSHAVVFAMRYVIVIVAIAFFLIWDGVYNHGHYLDVAVKEASRIVRYVTG
jgi:hypothetical protein